MQTTPFELDQLKAGLRQLDQRLARQQDLEWRREQRRGIARLQWGLWPLWLGQGLQMLFGLACILLGVSVWRAAPLAGAMFFSGVIVHACGVACIVLGGMTLGLLAKIDRGDALLTTQTRLEKLRRLYIVGGATIGLAWWLFWIPFMAAFFYWLSGGRADLYANLGSTTIAIMLGAGITGLLATWWFHRWSRSATRPRLAKAMDTAVTGHSLTRARQRLRELQAFAEQ